MEPLKACTGTTRVTFGQVLRRRPFFALSLARFISSVGDWLALLPLFSLIAFQRHGSAAATSMVMISFSVPVILLGPVAGAFVDRSNLKRTLIICDLVCAVLAALLAFSGHLYQMYLLMAGLSAASCFFIPGQTAALPLIVPENELLVANSINVQTLQLNQIFAPAVVGFAVAWLGEKNCFYLDSASFIISALLVSTIPIERTAARDVSAGTTIWADLKAGLKFITRTPSGPRVGTHNRHCQRRSRDLRGFVRGICQRSSGRRLKNVRECDVGVGSRHYPGSAARRQVRTETSPAPHHQCRVFGPGNFGFRPWRLGNAGNNPGRQCRLGCGRSACFPERADIRPGRSPARDVGAGYEHSYVCFCRCATWCICL